MTPSQQIIYGVNNQPVKILGKISLVLNFQSIPTQHYNSTMLVADLHQPMIIIGIEFMNINYVKIDFSKYLLSIDSKNIHFGESKRIHQNNPDKRLLDMNAIYYVRHKKINQLVEKYFPDPNLIGKIKEIEHSITLNTNTPIWSKPTN